MAMPIHEREALEKKAAPRKAAINRKQAQNDAATKQRERIEKIQELRHRQERLVERLDLGAERIENARATGKDVTEWEDYWIQLLREYEGICEQLRELEYAEID